MAIADRYIRATTLIGFRELVENAGGNAVKLLLAANLDPKLLDEPDGLMSYNKLGNLLEIASRDLARPSLGLEWSQRVPDHAANHGPILFLAKFVDTLQEWMDTGLEYWKYHTNAFTMLKLPDEATGLVAFRYVTLAQTYPARQLTETVLANVCRMTRVVTERPNENPAIIRFQHHKPRDLSFHEQVLRCPIEFGAEHDEIVFPPEMLAYKTNGNLKLLKPLLGFYIKSRIDRMPLYDQSMTTTIALAIQSVIGTGKCNFELIAGAVGVPPKRLQRLLAAEGTTFTEILDDVRSTMAQNLLAQSDAPIANIAGLLDYSSNAPFTLAFKRWTGQTPVEFRKQQRATLELSN